MSKYFLIRHPLVVKIGDEERTFYIRELGLIEFDELKRKALALESNKDAKGLALMDATVLASVELEDRKLAYTAEEWRAEIKDVFLQVGKAAMKAQGLDVDRPSEPEMTAEEVEATLHG